MSSLRVGIFTSTNTEFHVDDYTMKMLVFDELVNLLGMHKNYGVQLHSGFHNEEIEGPFEHIRYELITFPIHYETFGMNFDYHILIGNLLKQIKNSLARMTFEIEEDLTFTNFDQE